MIKCEFENGGRAKLRHVTASAIALSASMTKHVIIFEQL